MDLPRDSEFPADLSPLAWVQEELRRSLESVHKTLRRFLRDGDSRLGSLGGEVQPSQALLGAAAQLHQVAGVVALVGLSGGATVLRAAEAAVARLARQPLSVDLQAVETIERADFALLAYIARLLAGSKTSSLALFAPYRELQQLNDAERIHPADLWSQEFAWRELPAEPAVQPLAPSAARAAFEAMLLRQMRGPRPEYAAGLSDLCAGLAAGLAQPQARTLWQLAAAQFQAQALGLLNQDVYLKRLGSRLLAQLRAGGDAGTSQRLAQDLLFFCAQSRASAEAPRLAAVREVYHLGDESAGDYEDQSLGRIDPSWVAQARRRVGLAKDSWSAAAEGETARMAGLDEQFAGVAESLGRLFPSGEVLGETLQRAVVATLRSNRPPKPDLAMEVATCLLYVEAALDDAAFDKPEQAERVRELARRVESVAHGEPPKPLDDWMEELYRRVSDRQTLGSVVHELRASLSEIERQVDLYFREPDKRELLIPVPGQLQAMRGVLSVLGLDQAALASLRMRDEVDRLANTEVDPEREGPRELFERLANNLGAMGFMIDMLSVQPALAKRMFRFDNETGRLDALMGRRSGATQVPAPSSRLGDLDEPSLTHQVQAAVQAVADGERDAGELARDLERLSLEARAADETGLAQAAQSAQRLLESAPAEPEALSQATQSLQDFIEARAPAPEPAYVAAPITPSVPADIDEEMLGIFLEEAEEVLTAARAGLVALERDPQDLSAMTDVRRAFHTLKGSSRMVGLNAFGEGAWACEQLYNARLGEQAGADPALLAFTAEALDYLADWRHIILARESSPHNPDGLRHSADALRLEGRLLPLDWPAPTQLFAAESAPAGELTSEPQAVLEPELPLAELPEVLEEAAALPDFPEFAPELVPELELDTAPAAESLDAVHESTEMMVLEPAFDLLATPSTPAQDVAAPLSDADLPSFELHLDLGELVEPSPVDEPVVEAELAPVEPPISALPALTLVSDKTAERLAEPELAPDESEEDVKVIGPLRISITLFNIFLNEADELSRRLSTSLAEWALELSVPVPASCEVQAHALAGNAATVGYEDLSALARALEHALERAQRAGGYSSDEAQLFVAAADELRRLLHQFAAGFLKPVDTSLVDRLQAYVPQPAPEVQDSGPLGLEQLVAASAADDADFSSGQPDQIDAELFPIFEQEAGDLLEQLHASLRDWAAQPQDRGRAAATMRALHTFKGGARLSGAMRLGEQAHVLESAVEDLLRQDSPAAGDVQQLQAAADALEQGFDELRRSLMAAPAAAVEAVPEPVFELPAVPAAEPVPAPLLETLDAPSAVPSVEPLAEPDEATLVEPGLPDVELLAAEAPPAVAQGAQIDWTRFAQGAELEGSGEDSGSVVASQALVRVRGALIERMASQAGEVSIRRSRLESELSQMKSALIDLDDNLERLRTQMRELELQAEAQMGASQDAAKQAGRDFDPLEFDRFTRFQELTRMLAESVGDVATVQRSLQRNVQLGEDELAAQSRLTRELQDDLLRTRMVEFDSLAERLHRVVRQAARDAGKQVQLEIVGGHIDMDRSVLERLTGAFEHLLRNSVSHGIEAPEARLAAGKAPQGTIKLQLAQEGNEVVLTFADDGAGLNLAAIRERGEKLGLVAQGAPLGERELMELVFTPGFSTASQVTELAGRGVGMDVVRSEVDTLGGFVSIESVAGQGARFELHVPLTTALTQIVQLRYGDASVAVPASLMESVQRMPLELVEQAYASGQLQVGDASVPFYWLGGLLRHSGRGLLLGRNLPVVLIRSAQQRLAVHVDEVLGNQEVVVKNLGPQLSGVPGLAGISLLASGDVALIYNPVALAHWYGAAAQVHAQHGTEEAVSAEEAPEVLAPLVLVVDDSLTVRRVTQRLLEREGYRVELAKDGLDAMEKLGAEELPAVVLSDIEMPRMDGFDLVRNMRADARLAPLPVIMITSRIAQKHRDYAQELGVDHYLGKPYDEDLLLSLIGKYTSAASTSTLGAL
ncbi:MAG: hybrid sensor histidine kinase/response regulator [Methylibium sp.]|nr:hybrid sensor histidine kinase/response regulator [Methylibium sp.]